jgi:hypothetical protein
LRQGLQAVSEMDAGDQRSAVKLREVVGVVHGRLQLDALAERLVRAGLDRSEISLMASRDAVTSKLKTLYGHPIALANAPCAPAGAREPGQRGTSSVLTFGTSMAVGSLGTTLAVLASGRGPVLALFAAVVGGAAAAAMAKIIWDHVVGELGSVQSEIELETTGLVTFVPVRDPEHEATALRIMRACGAEWVHVHEIWAKATPVDIPLSRLAVNPVPEPMRGSPERPRAEAPCLLPQWSPASKVSCPYWAISMGDHEGKGNMVQNVVCNAPEQPLSEP